ncbi:hypothetical protein F2P81_003916 [Scophthalmus maximus]|uniref:Uncharacterized protein n=1 Tax=Scophthalmus maximus TaxID=52904 RepID=A0A6A4TJV9_SCOMX|nr:hypothetical protein F2P81_003916 [Scophthalmus maximus]
MPSPSKRKAHLIKYFVIFTRERFRVKPASACESLLSFPNPPSIISTDGLVKSYFRTDEDVANLIPLRREKDHLFSGKRFASAAGWVCVMSCHE